MENKMMKAVHQPDQAKVKLPPLPAMPSSNHHSTCYLVEARVGAGYLSPRQGSLPGGQVIVLGWVGPLVGARGPLPPPTLLLVPPAYYSGMHRRPMVHPLLEHC